jgi:hypothetical protein
MQARTQFQLDQLAEIGDEVFLCPEVSCLKTLYIRLVKGLELQGNGPRGWLSGS